MRVSTIGMLMSRDDGESFEPDYASAVLQLAKVTVDGHRITGCAEADEEAGRAVCVQMPDMPCTIVRKRDDIGYRMVEVSGVVRIGI